MPRFVAVLLVGLLFVGSWAVAADDSFGKFQVLALQSRIDNLENKINTIESALTNFCRNARAELGSPVSQLCRELTGRY
jgi:hypothetical protein